MKMNNNENKKIISQSKLYDIMYNYIKPELNKCNEMGGYWHNASQAGAFYWHLISGVGTCDRHIGLRLCDDHWEIYNDMYFIGGNVNIKIYNDHIEFIEDSKFTDFSKEELYSLYTFLNERIFNIKENKNKEENING